MGHYIAPDGSIYVDTDFINRVHKLPGMSVEHMGFGEFYLTTPKGRVEFDRMRGKPFEGQGGRSHKFYDDKGGDNIAKDVVEQMERKNLSEPAQAKTASLRIASPNELAQELRQLLAYSGSEKPSRQLIASKLRELAHKVAGVQTRPLHEIADEIQKDWKKVNYAAKPYLEAMMGMDKVTDSYGMDSGKSVVLYFLNNAGSWRGPKAKEIKDELKKMVK